MNAPHRPKQDGREERHQGLAIERYGEVMAYRRHFPPAHATEVLLRLGVQPWQWEVATRAWGAAMASALARDEPETITRFARAFSTTERRLREFPPRIESLGEPLALQAAPLPAAPQATAAPALPSYMSEAAASAPWPPPSSRAATPMATPLPVPAVRAAPPPALPDLRATVELGATSPRPILPFSPQGAPPPPAATPAHGSALSAQAGLVPPRPGMRLRRFNPETGEPLAVPVWEDPPP